MCESFWSDDDFGNELVASEEIIYLDRAIEENSKIQSSLEKTIKCIENLKSKYEESANKYFYNFTPSKKLTRDCARAEYLIYSIYDIHLTKLCQRLDLYSPQRHQKFRRLTYVPSSCSSSPSTSSTEQLQIEDEAMLDETGEDRRMATNSGYRTHKDVLRVYNKMKTEKIKSNREIEGALMSLDKAMTLSTCRATEAKNYAWMKEKLRTPKRNTSLNLHYRRSISTSMCRVRHSTPIQIIKRPLSSSVIF